MWGDIIRGRSYYSRKYSIVQGIETVYLSIILWDHFKNLSFSGITTKTRSNAFSVLLHSVKYVAAWKFYSATCPPDTFRDLNNYE